MSFDDLRSEVAPPQASMMASAALGFGGSRSALPAPAQLSASVPRRAFTRDNPQELEVFLFGPGAEKVAGKFADVGTLDGARASRGCGCS